MEVQNSYLFWNFNLKIDTPKFEYRQNKTRSFVLDAFWDHARLIFFQFSAVFPLQTFGGKTTNLFIFHGNVVLLGTEVRENVDAHVLEAFWSRKN